MKLAVAALLGLTMSISMVTASHAQNAGEIKVVYPADAPVDGHTPSQHTTDWWQWAMSFPPETSPVRDLTGSNCALGQQGLVWFLSGGFGSAKIHRTCTIPEGKILFFPLINMSYWPDKANNGSTCQQAMAGAALNNDTAIDLFAEIDGVAVNDLKKYRASSSECFDIFERIPPDQRPYNAYPSASDGYWLSVKPLQKGRHTLKFGGRYNRNSPYYGHMVQDIEYDLIVQ